MYKLIAKGILGQTLKTKTVKDKKFSTINRFRNKVAESYGMLPVIEIMEVK